MTKDLHSKLAERCKASNIETEIKDLGPDDDPYIIVYMPNGRERKRVSFFQDKDIKKFLKLSLEQYAFLGDYLAIANYDEGTIEALIRPLAGRPRSYLHRQLFGELEEGEDLTPIILKQDDDPNSISIEIGEASSELKLLAKGPYRRASQVLSLKISGIKYKQHNKCLEFLRKTSDSLFFQIDLHSDIAVSLIKDRRPIRRLRRRQNDKDFELEFPRTEIDEGAASLYWYARSAVGMPLLQFLAFYQVVEFYYPTYSQEEARRRVRVILKDPTFRTDRDSDIGKVIGALTGQGRGFGDERSQLRATINACVSADDIRSYLLDDEEREKFFSSKQKGLTDHKLNLKNEDIDLRNSISDLIYDIRCKIVHTKGGTSETEVELLLPFSKEAELLFHDIELLHYIATKVLIAASTPISL